MRTDRQRIDDAVTRRNWVSTKLPAKHPDSEGVLYQNSCQGRETMILVEYRKADGGALHANWSEGSGWSAISDISDISDGDVVRQVVDFLRR